MAASRFSDGHRLQCGPGFLAQRFSVLHVRWVPGPSIILEEVAEGTAQDLIAVVAADEVSSGALSTLRSSAWLRFVPAVPPTAVAPTLVDRAPAMLVAVGDARVDGCARVLVGSKQAGVLSVAIIAVESLQSASHVEIDPLARVFDAVLPVVVARGVDAETPLSRALAALTAFATANCISLPVDEVYPFFVRGGQLMCGTAEGDDVVAAAAMALAAAQLGGTSRVRMLLHIETTQHDLMHDLALASQAAHRAVRVDDFWPTASVSGGTRKRISLIATAGIVSS